MTPLMSTRDQLLRYVAQESGRRTALTIANALRNARNDEDQLEIEVVEAFRSLGFDATRVGGKGTPMAWRRRTSVPIRTGSRVASRALDAKSRRRTAPSSRLRTLGLLPSRDIATKHNVNMR